MDFSLYRKNLVECQLYPNGIVDQDILNVFRDLPREKFYSAANAGACYGDEDVQIKKNRWALEPVTEARIIHKGNFKAQDVVLIIGASSPTLAAYLSHFVTTVIVIDKDKELLNHAQTTCLELELCNIVFEHVELYKQGCPAQAPFDKIIFAGAIAKLPKEATDQLTPNGSIIAIERQSSEAPGALKIYYNNDANHSSDLNGQFIANANTPYLPGMEPEICFEF